MEFFISPENRQSLELKLEKMFKHLDRKPEVKISSAEQVVKTVITDYGDGISKSRSKIQACHVEIEDIGSDGWILVATVAYDIKSMLMSDSRYFKQIPEQYGLQYTKCDHCGSVHKGRKESHILYNPEKDQWMQVGSTCVNKMLNGGKYLNSLMLELYDLVKFYGGCSEEEWESGSWRPSNKYLFEAVRLDEAVTVCEDFMRKYGNVWIKSSYDRSTGRKMEGTNDELIRLFKGKIVAGDMPETDLELFQKVKMHYDTVPYGEHDGYEKTLTQKIKDAFKDEYINLCEMYIAWFALSDYKSTITRKSFETTTEELGIARGAKLDITNATLIGSTYVIPEYWDRFSEPYYDCVFCSNGVNYSKHLSNMKMLDKYKNEDGTYSFSSEVKYVNFNRQIVHIGRLSKVKSR